MHFLQRLFVSCFVLLAGAVSVSAQSARTTQKQPPAFPCYDVATTVNEARQLNEQWKVSSLRAAVSKYAQARQCFRDAHQTNSEAEVLRSSGDILYQLSEYQLALVAYKETLALFRTLRDQRAEARTLSDLGIVYFYLGDTKQALKNCEAALSLSRSLGDASAQAHALNCLGKCYLLLGELREASERLSDARSLLQDANDEWETADVLLNIGHVQFEEGQFQKALQSYQQVLPIWEGLKYSWGEARTVAALARVYTITGERQKAIEYNRKSLELARTIGNLAGEAAALNNSGWTYAVLGEHQLALDNYLQALAIFERIKSPRGQIATLRYVGDTYDALGQKEKARESYEAALSLVRSLDKLPLLMEAEIRNQLGLLNFSMNQLPAALESYQTALAIFEKANSPLDVAYTLNYIGLYQHKTGETQKALESYRRALAAVRAARDSEGEILTLHNIASAEEALGRLAEARAHIEESITLIESSRAKVSSESLRSSYVASIHEQYELYVDILMELHKQHPDDGYDRMALEVVERGRARSLLETLAEARTDIRRGVDSALLRKEESLREELAAKAHRQTALLNGQTTVARTQALEAQIRALTNDYQEVRGQIRASSPRYAELTQPKTLTSGEIQKLVDDETVLLEYSLGDTRSYVWAVTPGAIKAFVLPGRNLIEPAARRLTKALTEPNRTEKNETWPQKRLRMLKAEAELPQASATLSRMILEPVASLLREKRLVVIADGALQLVPFAGLPIPASVVVTNTAIPASGSANNAAVSAARPLISEHEIITLASASVLGLQRAELANRKPSPLAVAVLADPVFDQQDERVSKVAGNANQHRRGLAAAAKNGAALKPGGHTLAAPAISASDGLAIATALRDIGLDPNGRMPRLEQSRQEALAILRVAPPNQSFSALDFKASRQTAMSPQLSQYRIIHFATHGVMDFDHPELSGIVLSMIDENGQPQDGYLRLHEIYNLNLPAELVVLSACQTGVGKEIRGEGLIALTRGFMYAGAARVVASLWKVDDAATSELMAEFYSQMFTNKLKPAAALRAAQIKMSQQKRWQSPYYWAGFFLQGEWN
jgi:CHAT domain-containing protein/Tfp pilus assembly protein PilF